MKVLRLKPVCSKEQMSKRQGEWVSNKDFDTLIDFDCDAFDEKEQPVFFFRKNIIPAKICRDAWKIFRHAANPSNNRGAAGGIVTSKTANMPIAKKSKHNYYVLKKDGTQSKTTLANTVKSGIVGYFDRNARYPYCRQTEWFAKNFESFKKAYPYINLISKNFESVCPERYAAQKSMADKTNPDFLINNTVFTTITVNKNFRTALHVDAGDYKEGLGNLAVLEGGKYKGGYTVLPRYRVAFDVRSGDVCFFNVHEYHANTPIVASMAYERISIVCYYREKMIHCLSAKDELLRAQNRLAGEKLT